MTTVAEIVSDNSSDFLAYAKAYQENLVASFLSDYAREITLIHSGCLYTDGSPNTFLYKDYAILVKGKSTEQIFATAIGKALWLKEPDCDYKVSLCDDPDCVIYHLVFDWKQSNMYELALRNSMQENRKAD